jgi:NADH-ubiquinone oxidoreductase chain 5
VSGIISYLLISFWFTRLKANKAAIEALLINRIGDIFFSIGLFSIFWLFGNLDYTTIFTISNHLNSDLINIICILFLIGGIAKSAQIGLHTWLIGAIEGATPVSALLHSSTIVNT